MKVRSLRAQLALVIALASVLPVALTAGVLTWRATAQRQTARRTRAAEAAASLCRATEVYVDAHVAGIRALAGALAGADGAGGAWTDDLDARLARFHAAYDGFVSVLAARADGAVVGAHPRRRLDGAGPVVLANVADRA